MGAYRTRARENAPVHMLNGTPETLCYTQNQNIFFHGFAPLTPIKKTNAVIPVQAGMTACDVFIADLGHAFLKDIL
jgi:hypothetical protein